MRIELGAAWLAVVAPAAAQTSFEVASVRASPPARISLKEAPRESIEPSPGNLVLRNISLRSSIGWAYGLRDFQIAAPGWLESEKYDIVAKAPGMVTHDQLRGMLRALLEERFKLVVHGETKGIPGLRFSRGQERLPARRGQNPGARAGCKWTMGPWYSET